MSTIGFRSSFDNKSLKQTFTEYIINKIINLINLNNFYGTLIFVRDIENFKRLEVREIGNKFA